MSKLFRAYKKSLKDYSVDEALDFFLFRPFAFIIVLLVYKLPITPNQLSLVSLIVGITSGFFFSTGDTSGFFYGGVLYGLTRVVDCSDGMLARLKKNGTPLGRVVDGMVDHFSAFVVFAGLAIGIARAGFKFPISHWVLLLVAGICMTIHSRIIDYYRTEFIIRALDEDNSTRKSVERFSIDVERMKEKKGKYFDRFLVWLYLGYSDVQILKKPVKKRYDQKTYYHANKLLLRLWSLIGSSTYIFVLMISSVIYEPGIFLFYALGAANIWMCVLLIIQIKTNKKIAIKSSL